MAEEIQFPCPACGASLRLPLAMAGIQGPCPLCQQEIIAPDPSSNLPARIPTPGVPPPAPEAKGETPAPTPSGVSRSARPEKHRIPFLPILLTAVLCLAAGYFFGAKSVCPLSMAPPPPKDRPIPPPADEPEAPAPEPAPPTSEPTPDPEPKPLKVSAAAEAALKAFLDAPDWPSRAAHVLTPDAVRPAMEAYSVTVPDGPTPWKSISVQNSYTDRDTGNTLFIFKVVTEAHPTGIPVAVAETASGWLVDWQAFVEFRDDRFASFADGPVDQSGRFHLLVSATPPPRAANTENEHFSSFLLEPPFPDQQRLAYVRKTSAIHAVLSAATANGVVFTPVLEVAKRKTPDGKSYLEITDIVAHDWLPEGR